MLEILTIPSVVAYGLILAFLGGLILAAWKSRRVLRSRILRRWIEDLGNIDIQ